MWVQEIYKSLISFWISLFRSKRKEHYILETFSNRALANKAIKGSNLLALLTANGVSKWIMFECPCGCAQKLSLNLMKSHKPNWRIWIASATDFTIEPSIDSTTCKAHFWIKRGKVIWC
jgi:hypothetical protein